MVIRCVVCTQSLLMYVYFVKPTENGNLHKVEYSLRTKVERNHNIETKTYLK